MLSHLAILDRCGARAGASACASAGTLDVVWCGVVWCGVVWCEDVLVLCCAVLCYVGVNVCACASAGLRDVWLKGGLICSRTRKLIRGVLSWRALGS